MAAIISTLGYIEPEIRGMAAHGIGIGGEQSPIHWLKLEHGVFAY